MIPQDNPIEGLEKVFCHFLNLDINVLDSTKYYHTIPEIIRLLYVLKDVYTNKVGENRLFLMQDALIWEKDLNLSGVMFDFLVENQGNWVCQTYQNERNPVVWRDTSDCIHNSLNHFLTTYAFQELSFFLACGLWHISKEEVEAFFTGATPLWIKKTYIYDDILYNFYQVEEDCFLMDTDMGAYFSTMNESKYDAFVASLQK